jgi:hypothetical protein
MLYTCYGAAQQGSCGFAYALLILYSRFAHALLMLYVGAAQQESCGFAYALLMLYSGFTHALLILLLSCYRRVVRARSYV